MPSRPPRDSSDAEIDALAAICGRLAGFDDRVSLQWIDGYLIAVASAPYTVALDECLQRMLGDAFERCFADPEDAAAARAHFALRLEVLADQLDPEALLDEPDALRVAPLMDLWTDEDRERLISEEGVSAEEAQALQSGQAWADGFEQACMDFAADWVPSHSSDDADADLAELLEQIVILGEAGTSPRLAEHLKLHHAHGVPPTREDLLDEACFAVQDLRLWWLDHAPSPRPRRAPPVPRRNDPCPCGSGRKYKKCHGLAGAAPL